MLEQVDEPVRVYVDFNMVSQSNHQGHSVRPVAFFYGRRKYIVEHVNLVSEAGTGPTKRFLFSVSDAANSFTLEYNPFSLQWKVREVFLEG